MPMMKVFPISRRLAFVIAQSDLYEQAIEVMIDETEWRPKLFGFKLFGHVVGFVFSW